MLVSKRNAGGQLLGDLICEGDTPGTINHIPKENNRQPKRGGKRGVAGNQGRCVHVKNYVGGSTLVLHKSKTTPKVRDL